MNEKMEKSTFLNNLRSSRSRWDAALASLDRSKMETPVEKGAWSIKDIIAHVTWFEREMLDLLDSRTLVGSDLWNLPQDERNAAIYEENRNRQLSEVLAEASRVYQQMLAEVEDLTDEEMNDPKRFKNMPGDWVPWEIVAQNTYQHYDAHLPDIEKTS